MTAFRPERSVLRRPLMMVRVPVVGQRADERPGCKRKGGDQSELDAFVERQPHAEVVGDDRDDECDEYANDEPHRFNLWLRQLRRKSTFFTTS